MENQIFDAIILLVRSIKADGNNPRIEAEHDGLTYIMQGSKYLLGQLIRQISVPEDRIFISVKAEELWASITNEPIQNYWYQTPVTCMQNGVKVKKYKGASRKDYEECTLQKGETFPYKDVFHDEHIVPIKMIIDELIAEHDLDYDGVARILSKICICRITKEEDAAIKHRYKRPDSFEETIRTTYKEAGIVIKGFKY